MSSSTFSSDQDRGQKVWLALLALGALLAIALANGLYGWFWEEQVLARTALVEPTQKEGGSPFRSWHPRRHALTTARNVFMGSSYFRWGINPEELPETAVITLNGMDYRLMEIALRRNSPFAARAEHFFLELDYVGFYADAVAARKGDYTDLYTWGIRCSDLRGLRATTWEERLNRYPLFAYPRITPRELAALYLNFPSYSHRSDPAESPPKGGGSSPAWWWTQEQKPSLVWADNREAILRMVSTLQAAGREITFVRSPHAPAYWRRIGTAWLAPELAGPLGEIEVWDFTQGTRLQAEHFPDGTHLNAEGSKIFTELIAERMARSRQNQVRPAR